MYVLEFCCYGQCGSFDASFAYVYSRTQPVIASSKHGRDKINHLSFPFNFLAQLCRRLTRLSVFIVKQAPVVRQSSSSLRPRQIKVFHVDPQWVGGTKFCTNG